MKFKCKHCDCTTEVMVFVPFVAPKRLHVSDPKYCFHIKSTCFDCHRFNGFKPQTDELMAELKGCAMMNLDLEQRELPFADEEHAINS